MALKMYLCAYISVIIHEVAHFGTFYLMSGVFNSVVIGSTYLSVKVWKFSFSPILLTGYNEIQVDELERMGKKEQVVFYLSGVMSNFIIVCYLIIKYMNHGISVVMIFMFVLNIVIITINLLPIEGTDCNEVVKIIRKKKR